MNLVQSVLNLLNNDDLLNKLAGLLGLSKEKTQSAVQAAVPALMGALVSQASSTDGARRLATAVSGADDGLLGNLAGTLEGRGHALADSGTSSLQSLLPSGTFDSMAGALAKYAGIDTGKMTALVSTLAPLALGFIKKQSAATGGDASSVARLLISQKDDIASALPPGLSQSLASVPGFKDLGGMVERAGDVVSDRVRSGATQAGDYGRRAAAAAPGMAMLWWLVPVLAAVGVGYWLWSRSPNEPALAQNEPKPAAKDGAQQVVANRLATDADSLAKVKENVGRFTTDFTDAFGSIDKTLASVKDVDTAQAAVPKLRDLTDKLGKTQDTMSMIPAAQRSTITDLVEKSRKTLEPIIDKLMAIPGVEPILKPVIDQLMAKLDTLAPTS